MSAQETLLLALKGTQESFHELKKVVQAAEQLDQKVILLVIAYNESLDSHYWFDGEGKQQAQDSYCQSLLLDMQNILEKFNLGSAEATVPIELKVIWGKRLHEVVRDYCQEHPVDWVAKACEQHSLVERVFFTHSDWHLIREIDKPLWLIKTLEPYKNPLLAVAVDPTQSNDKPHSLDIELIQSAKSLAERFGGSYSVMHAYDPIPPTLLTDIGTAAAQEITEQIASQHRQAFRILMDQQQVAESQQYLVEDDVHHALPEWLQRKGAELLLIGAVKRSKVDQWLLGSTAERLLESVETDILVLKPKDNLDL